MIDVTKLNTFYKTESGYRAQKEINRLLTYFLKSKGFGGTILGFGYLFPYKTLLEEKGSSFLCFMPQEQGIVNTPFSNHFFPALVDKSAFPLPDASINLVILLHSFENVEERHKIIEESYRILVPNGSLIIITPRLGCSWVLCEESPFYKSATFTKYNIYHLLRDYKLIPVKFTRGLYTPSPCFSSPLQKILHNLFSFFVPRLGGLIAVEAIKTIYGKIPEKRKITFGLENVYPVPSNQTFFQGKKE